MTLEDIKEARRISKGLRRSRKFEPLTRVPSQDYADAEIWMNRQYEVTSRKYKEGWPFGGGEWMQIGIASTDGDAVHDWRDMQSIKNQICGPEWEAIELFPRESRLVDPSNYYILYCAPKIPIGIFKGRIVHDVDTCVAPQRGFWKDK